eukprot:CAMPEP_0114450378 /NCGR_PEP_ID=MMETSP0104-20121206/427_1 /TAXON_ID=37642 ORGANISM="Paraphysomonas imperforata, Strain PA2" /NCGR_SAMPLE_ID=MMETSP0104 /ASSEMBLY_ACC=CAM_ASM_000202 /LENGTH=466 /DNA_ID=CAMNT_0001622513 /DNA_START=24 /DNA_END=1423 /DNA_ORIENTATION=+
MSTKVEEGDSQNQSPEDINDVGEEYQALLDEANTEDLSVLERDQILQTGLTLSGDRVIIFMPRLGFHDNRDSNSQLRRMLLLKKAHSIVSQPYIFVYDHMQFSIFTQHPLIYRTYSMLPRQYKKNIKRMIVVHPNFLIRVFFEHGVKHFVSQKFYNKLKFVDSIIELQPLIMPLGGALPSAFIRRGDAKTTPPKPSYDPAHMPPLTVSFNPSVGTTDIIHQCVTYLTAENRLQTKGLFRLAGDQAVLDLAQARLFGRLDQPPTVIIGTASYQDNANCTSSPPKSAEETKSSAAFSTLVVNDVHTVTSIMTQSFRHLAESLIVPDVSTRALLSLTRKFEKDHNIDEWHSSVTPLLSSMPECHYSTLQHLLRFLAHVTMESSVNEMTVENVSRVFAPTLFPEAPLDTANPMLAFADVQLQKIILTQLITKYMQEEESMVANVKLSSKMMNRFTRPSSSDDFANEDEDV